MEEKIISEIIKRLKRSDRLYQIKAYLKNQGILDNDIESYIDKAQNRIYDDKLKSLPKTKKFIFYTLIVFSFSTFFTFLFILPKYYHTQTTTLSIIGAIILSASLLYGLVYYKSWEKDRIEQELELKKQNKNDISAIFIFIPFPAIVFYFIFSSVLQSGEDNLLKNTQIETEGIIVDGSSTDFGTLRRGTANYSSVTVEFLNQNGKKIRATEDISEYEFKNFNKGQKVKLIYSLSNPQNIDLLTNKSDITKFTGSEERDFTASDLIQLKDTLNQQQTSSLLNKIIYGWEFNVNQNNWENKSQNMLFTKNDNEISLLMDMRSMHKFPKQFIELGFKDITKGKITNAMIQKERLLENNEYLIKIERKIIVDNKPYYLTTIKNK